MTANTKIRPEDNNLEIEKEFSAMQGIFKLFSLCFRYPGDMVYDSLQQNRHLLREMAGAEDYSLPGQSDLEAEFVGLFVNNKGFVPVVPYASYYLEEDGLLFGPKVGDLSRMMQEVGLEVKEGVTEPPDHIYLLLEFCGELAGVLSRERDYKNCSYFLLLQNVLCNYLSPMLEEFVRAISNHASLGFYEQMGKSLQEYISFQSDLCQNTQKSLHNRLDL